VTELGIEGHVTFVPWIDDVREVYAAIDLHCNCSTREPFDRTTIEAAAAGVPAVCYADGGAPEAMIPGLTGIAAPPGDVEALALAIVTYVTDTKRRQEDGAAARLFAERYDARLHGRIGQVIRSVAERSRVPWRPKTFVNTLYIEDD
jgi:glycosyltransferase involved in cell wall biosynthesis